VFGQTALNLGKLSSPQTQNEHQDKEIKSRIYEGKRNQDTLQQAFVDRGRNKQCSAQFFSTGVHFCSAHPQPKPLAFYCKKQYQLKGSVKQN